MSSTKKYRESVAKRHTRSIHEKKRRQEMNEVIDEMIEIIPEVNELFEEHNKTKATKKPDKCFVISYLAGKLKSIARNNVVPASNPLLRDCVTLTDCLILKMKDFIINEVEGDSKITLGQEKEKLLLKDFRSFLNFDCAVQLPLRIRNSTSFLLRTCTGKLLSCASKSKEEDSSLVVVLMPIPCFENVPKQPRAEKSIVEESPLLAALLRKSDNEPSTSSKIAVDTATPTASLHCDSASASSPPFLSPLSAGSGLEASSAKVSKNKKQMQVSRRKRLRSVSAIVESFSLDHPPERANNFVQPAPSTSTFVPQTCQPMVFPLLNVNPYEVLAPGYRDIWLRLQSERRLLEERVLAKERELQGLMLSALPLPNYTTNSFPPIPQYSSAPSTEVITTQMQ